MKTVSDYHQENIYLAAADRRADDADEQHRDEKDADLTLSGKIETLRDSLVDLMKELDTLKVTARKMEAFKSLDAVVGENDATSMHEMVRQFEIDLICRALEQTGGHQIRASRLLGMNVTTLNSMIKRHKINPLDYAVGSAPLEKIKAKARPAHGEAELPADEAPTARG
ncbi:MAG TPA: helix-turn-helix domain-containing protein, partial [Pyrinomonadaceae bacterium]|nr:helix-turn-helix domain-containing protein [Pyrinomonadaceae bacterium]